MSKNSTRRKEESGTPTGPVAPSLAPTLGIWVLIGILLIGILTTYSRLPLSELYNVSRIGLEGGLSRALVFLNYPVAFLAIPLIVLAVARLLWSNSVRTSMHRGVVLSVAALALGLSLVAAIPGVVDQHDLDARWVNAVPAVGVLLAIGLTIVAIRVAGSGRSTGWSMLDNVRVGVTTVAAVLSLPWIFANFGVYIGDIPGLGAVFMSRQIPEWETTVAVHLGDHHGMNGITFLVAGLWLSRELTRFVSLAARVALASYLSLMMVYGTFIAAQDFWLEQFVKRGWVTIEIPHAVVPALTPVWGVIVVTTAVLAALLVRGTSPSRSIEQDKVRAEDAREPEEMAEGLTRKEPG